MKRFDVIIIGGGLAGLAAAIHLCKGGLKVLVFEKDQYPRHKVCGEYLSREVEPYLDFLGIDLPGAVVIDTLKLSSETGRLIEAELPMGGFGISRYALDQQFYFRAKDLDIPFLFETVKKVTFQNDSFCVEGANSSVGAKVVIGAYGKRSHLDKQLERNFIQRKSPWIGVKAHYDCPDFPDSLVELHHFKGGYGGLSKTESGLVNFCYLATYESFKNQKDLREFQENVLSRNPSLNAFFERAEPVFEKPLSIAQISFEKKEAVLDRILMCGDSAGLIHPLCGNGMAMAIHSAAIAAGFILRFFKDPLFDRTKMERAYASDWKKAFASRLETGRLLQFLLLQPRISEVLIKGVARSPWLVQKLIKKTHGEPVAI